MGYKLGSFYTHYLYFLPKSKYVESVRLSLSQACSWSSVNDSLIPKSPSETGCSNRARIVLLCAKPDFPFVMVG